MAIRQQLLSELSQTILEPTSDTILKVAIDGIDGAGKTHFANELAQVLQSSGRPIIRSSVDSFHRPRAERYRLGKDSPEGFFRDSYNYTLLKEVLLEPLSKGGSRRYQRAVFDHRSDSPLNLPPEEAAENALLLFDGIFLHRPELKPYWNFSIWLELPFAESYRRMAKRDGSSPDPNAPTNRRYLEGQKLYLNECQPQAQSSLVIDNSRLEAPFIISKKR